MAAFAVVGALILVSNFAAKHLTNGRVHGSAILIVLGLVHAYVGGPYTGGKKGFAERARSAGLQAASRRPIRSSSPTAR